MTTDEAKRGHAHRIEVSEVSKTFKKRRREQYVALEGVNMSIEPGEFVCLLGPSGCGKSTLLHIIAGLLDATAGTVKVGDETVRGPSPDRGLLFQQPSLFPWLTVMGNVMFSAGAQRRNRSESKKRARELIEQVGLGQFASSYPHELSGGMQHRVAFARALLNQPSVLLLDEPFAALDAITRTVMQEFLLQLWDAYGTSVVFVTHDIAEAATLADRVMVMSTHPGRLHRTVSVDLPRPRSIDVVESEEFLTVHRELRSSVSEVLAHDHSEEGA
jgi:NitT/TauT family transport system ATP-binding protein